VLDRPPRVHIVIPCFNHGRFVADAVRSCLKQDASEIRVVIVNDGSTDGASPAACDACLSLPSSMERGAVRVIHQSNAGLPAARNAGARIATDEGWADYLVFLDADDWIEASFVKALHQALEAADAPRASHAYCQERLVELGTGIWRVPAWDPALLLVTNLHPVTALVRRSAFEAVGGFDPSMRLGYEDWDLWLRMLEAGYHGVRVREPLFNWRRHSQATMISDAVSRHDALFAMLMERHPALYAAHASEIIRTSNALLRRADANWLDESGDAIVIRDLRAWTRDLVRERDDARQAIELERTSASAQARQLEADLARAREEIDQARADQHRIRSEYEAKPIVRLSRRLYGAVDRMPGFIAGPIRGAARLAKSVVR
jgi:glycosyltransferase involved in cell wall biosynthesis